MTCSESQTGKKNACGIDGVGKIDDDNNANASGTNAHVPYTTPCEHITTARRTVVG